MQGAAKQRNRIKIAVNEAMTELWRMNSASHEAAMAEDKLREAEFWVGQIRVDRESDEVVE